MTPAPRGDSLDEVRADGPTIFLAGGGSGGHTYPGLAVADELEAREPGVRCAFLCTDRRIDRDVLAPTGREFIPQPIVPPTRSVGGLLRFWQAWRATNDLVRRLMAERKPAAVLGLGGYAAGVAVRHAARHRGVASAILNPDVVPGKANLYLMRTCRRVYLGHDATLERLSDPLRAKCLTVGVPLRPDLFPPADRAEAAATLQLDPHLNTLVVTGASQGARTINEAVVEVSRRDAAGGPPLQGWQVLHLAGADHAEAVRAAWRQTPVAGRVRVIDFTPEMRLVWSVADLAISRSGAGSCAEIAAFGVPAIFMPYPFHKDNHQHANAAVLADAGAAVIVTDRREAEANAEVLLPTLDSLLHDAARREAMSAAAGRVARRDAAARVAEDLLATVRFGEAPT